MAARFVGQADLIESNKAPMGQIAGSQLGSAAPPGVIESLQERPSAAATSTLYYEEALGGFTQPSFQRGFGIRNTTVQNIDKWSGSGGSSGTFFIDEDMFWNGPALIKMKVQIPYRWRGTLVDGTSYVRGSQMMPQLFYSWGAGFAAIKQLRMNLGGAGQYTLDRYANFIAIMSSCTSIQQRMALMKLSGGGVIEETPTIESTIGITGSTATWGTIDNRWLGGVKGGSGGTTTIIAPNVRVPVEDNWMIPYKTPHTNYNNARIRRRPLDTKLFSQPFCIDFWLASFDEICDTGTGVCPLAYNDGGGGLDAAAKGNTYPTAFGNAKVWPEIGRQYQNYVNETYTYAADTIQLGYINGTSKTTFLTSSDAGSTSLMPLDANLPFNGTNDLLTTSTLPNLSIESVISSLRLTNDMLGAYDVLKTRTEVCVYYPFQHFSTQIYSVQNTAYGDLSLADYLSKTNSTSFPSTETVLQKVSLPINIPVNPMTAMYVAVAREKDRKTLGVSKAGGYSPCLFWNFLELPQVEITYGSQPLLRYYSTSDFLSEQVYEHITPLQIPYKGGFCLTSEALTTGSTALSIVKTINSSLYHGVFRNSWIYEISLVEMEPLRNEAFFQQTPSFLGEQLNLSFTINPSTLALTSQTYNPNHDYSLIDDYSVKPLENAAVMTDCCDLTGSMITLANDRSNELIPNSLKGGPAGTRAVDVWHMNNDANLMVVVVYAQNALWQLNPNASKLIFARG